MSALFMSLWVVQYTQQQPKHCTVYTKSHPGIIYVKDKQLERQEELFYPNTSQPHTDGNVNKTCTRRKGSKTHISTLFSDKLMDSPIVWKINHCLQPPTGHIKALLHKNLLGQCCFYCPHLVTDITELQCVHSRIFQLMFDTSTNTPH